MKDNGEQKPAIGIIVISSIVSIVLTIIIVRNVSGLSKDAIVFIELLLFLILIPIVLVVLAKIKK